MSNHRMEIGRASWTAINCAAIRAAHLLLDHDPKIHRDDLAMALGGFESEGALRLSLDERLSGVTREFNRDLARFHFDALRALMAARNRYAEDELARALNDGTHQYVLLGAGLDTFAHRRPDLCDRLRIYELDYPSTQAWKRERLAQLKMQAPRNLTYVPVDFEREDPAERLAAAGCRLDQLVFVSWLGVTQYLEPEATVDTLHHVAGFAPGSEIVFEYVVPEDELEGIEREYLRACKARSARQSEPWLGLMRPAALMHHLNRMGFAEAIDLDAHAINERYFAGRKDRLRVAKAHHLVKARV